MKLFSSIAFGILICIATNLKSQNLVQNPSFEDTISCPDVLGEFNKCDYWFNPSNNSPDYYNACYVYGPPFFNSVDVPDNYFGYQMAKFGSAYAGVAFFNSFQNLDYIGGKLISVLDSAKTYSIEFYVSLADSANLAIDKIGFVFTSTQYFESTIGKLNLQADIESDTILDNDTGWTKISGTYIAEGDEQFFIIGLFRDTSQFFWDTTWYDSQGGYGAYYYVDDVSVTEILDTTDTVEPIDTTIFEINLFPNPNSGEFALKYNLNSFDEGIFRIYNAIGQLVFEEKLIQNNGVRNLHLPIASGVYIWEVRSDEAVLKREKLVIQR